jgi:hypothetical protein
MTKPTRATGTTATKPRPRELRITQAHLESWYSDLQSALVVIQEVQFSLSAGGVPRVDHDSLLDGAHALIERASGDIRDVAGPPASRT